MKAINMKSQWYALILLIFSPLVMASVETDFAQGVEQFKQGDYDRAVQLFESAKSQGLESVALFYNLASSYFKLGQYEAAKKYFVRFGRFKDMQDLADFNLGLIALRQKNGTKARQYFTAVVETTSDEKLLELSKQQLSKLKSPDKPPKPGAYLSVTIGYDDNITAVADESLSGISDSFYELFLSGDVVLSGTRKEGWLIDASIYAIDFADGDSNDEERISLGVKKSQKLYDWETSVQLSLVNNDFAGDDYLTSTRLDARAKKVISRGGRFYWRYRFDDINSDQAIYDYLQGWRQRIKAEYRNYGRQNIWQVYYEMELNDRNKLVTASDAYDYSPTRHTLRAKHTHIVDDKWRLGGDLAYRFSDFPASSSVDRDDDRFKLILRADYRFNKTLKLNTQLQFTDNASTVERYDYDKTLFKVGLSKTF